MLNDVAELLRLKGYRQFSADKRFGAFIRESDDIIYTIIICMYNRNLSADDYIRIRQSVEFNLVTGFKKKTESLFMIINRDGIFDDNLTDIVSVIPNMWLMAADTGKIYIFENQPSDFDDNLNIYLESNLFRLSHSGGNEQSFILTPVNIAIVVINIIVYIAIIIINHNLFAVYDTETMSKMGALSYNNFVNGAYYEIITSVFLHFGISHLFNNMILLIYVGCELERRIGSYVYLIIYIVSGICGNIASLWYYNRIGETDIVSAGASGAIFGVLGCLAVYLAINPAENRNLTPRRLITMALLTIYYGLTSVGVDNAAHIGGFCFGLLGGFLLSKILHYDKLETVRVMR